MFARAKRFLGNILGRALYWIGWGFAVLVIAQAIILSVTIGDPLIAIILGLLGLIVWWIGIGLKYVLAGRRTPD